MIKSEMDQVLAAWLSGSDSAQGMANPAGPLCTGTLFAATDSRITIEEPFVTIEELSVTIEEPFVTIEEPFVTIEELSVTIEEHSVTIEELSFA